MRNMSRKTLKILLPTLPPKHSDKTTYFKGSVRFTELAIVIYLVEHSSQKEITWTHTGDLQNVIYGMCSGVAAKMEKRPTVFSNYIVFKYHNNGVPEIKDFVLNGNQCDPTVNCIIILYEYDKFKETNIIWDSDECLMKLQMLIQSHSKSTSCEEYIYEPVLKSPFWLSYTMFGQHVVKCINLVYWLFITIFRDRKISIKQGNLILAVIMDIFLGYIILQLFTLDEKEISNILMQDLEKLVDSLNSLLKWLMGAPAGLKLNNAFNNLLGKYFTYHIKLWSLFLDVIGEKLDVILYFFHYIGYAGITFQAAIISDMICIATFHSYCIYVYAARLFNIQVSGLIALLRLFVGRKYNPLRGSIDSCEYTNQELFVGTVAFTILLLLMPTTTMYYAVFTLFRLLSLVVQHALAKVIYVTQTQPSYIVGLWLINSSKVAGNVLVEVVRTEDKLPVILRLKLLSKSLKDLVERFKPPVEMHKHVEWSSLVSNILTGKQML